MKKKRTIIVLITGIIFGLIISGIGTYAATTYAISSNKVSYTDNSSLGVNNVQAAIDGTCSKVDDRLDSIESSKQDLLSTNSSSVSYTASNFSQVFPACNSVYKYGKVVFYTCTFVPATNLASQTLLFKLPTGYTPITYMRFPLIQSSYGTSYNAVIDENGQIFMENNNLLAGVYYTFSVSFVTK